MDLPPANPPTVCARTSSRPKRGEQRAIEVGLLNFSRHAYNRRAGIKQRLRDVYAEASVGSGYECNFTLHGISPTCNLL